MSGTSGCVDLALRLGVRPDRINTIVDFAAASRHGVKVHGSRDASDPAVLAELAGLVERGRLEVPVQAVYPLDRVRDAYALPERRHTLGKIVLMP